MKPVCGSSHLASEDAALPKSVEKLLVASGCVYPWTLCGGESELDPLSA